jgi:vacuolar-type H+-ATPase subunit I/STV1
MAKFAIADAANRAGVERTTLYRKMNKGEISAEIDAHGNKVIDASELLRVYPDAKVIDGPATVAPPLPPVEKLQTATGEATRGLLREVEIRDEKIDDMKRRIEALEADKSDLRSERDRLLKVIEEQSSSVKLLTEGVKAKEKTGRRFWLFGRRR